MFKHYDVSDGLANPTIHSIYQDRDGFLWIGTESGLSRYDGTHFKTFTVKDGLEGNEVFGLIQDKKGRIWLQQYKSKIAYIYNGRIYNQQNDTLLAKIKLTSRAIGMTVDKYGNIAFCDVSTLYIISGDFKSVKTINSFEGKPVSMVSLGTNKAGEILVCANHELFEVEKDRLKYIKKISPAPDIAPTLIAIHPNYITYALSESTKLIYLDDTTIEYKQPTGYPIKLSIVSDSMFSINTADGAILYNLRDFTTTRILNQIKVTNVFLDNEKNLWVGTVGSGLYKLSSRDIVNYKIGEGLNDIWYITKTDGRIIVGNNNSMVYGFQHGVFSNKVKLPVGNRILYVDQLSKKRLLVANENDLFICENGVCNIELYIVALKNIKTIADGKCLMSTYKGLYVVRKDDVAVTDTIWNRRTLLAAQEGDSILAGTTTGLYILKKMKNKWTILDSILHSSIITSTAKTSDGRLWVATYEDGLYCMKNGRTIHHFSDTSGLLSNNIRTIYNHNDDIWLGTDRGLAKIVTTPTGFQLKKYSVSDGLPSDIVNSIYVDKDTIYIGTPEGLCIFNESKIGTTSICNLVLTNVKIGNESVDLRNRYTIGRRERLVIEFSGISFRSEKEMSYRYKITCLDDTWNYTNLNTLEFTALPYGNYDIEIVAINKFGKESAPLHINLDIPRPFYKSTLSIILLSLLLFGTIFLLYTRWLNNKKLKQFRKLKQEIRVLELEQMALRAQMNPHFIFNCISTMQQLVMENDIENTNKFITSFSTLVRQTLDNAAEPFIPLDEEIKFLTSYLELERIRLEDRFSYAINSSGSADNDQPCVPNMVIQPFIENAIKHGVRYKNDGKGYIEINFVKMQETLICTITDNGIGRQKAMEMKQQAGAGHISKGMGITFKRMESLNSLTKGKISVDIDDIKDDGGHVRGTKVTIGFYKLCE